MSAEALWCAIHVVRAELWKCLFWEGTCRTELFLYLPDFWYACAHRLSLCPFVSN